VEELETDLGIWREESGLGKASRYTSRPGGSRASEKTLLRVGVPVAAIVLAVLIIALVPAGRNAVRGWLGTGAPPASMKVAILPCEPKEETGARGALCDGLLLTLTEHIDGMPGLPGFMDIVPAEEVRELKTVSPTGARLNHGANVVMRCGFDWNGDQLELDIARNDVSLETENGRESEIIKLRGSVSLADPLANLSTWQDTLVVRMLDLLELGPDMPQVETLSAEHTTIPAAFGLYLQGRGYLAPYLSDRDTDMAIESFTGAVEADPSYELARLGLGRAYSWKYWETREAKWADLAAACARRVIDKNEESVEARLLLGRISLNSGEYDSAVEALDEAISLDSTCVTAYADLAAVYRLTGDLDRARDASLEALRLDPDSYDANFELGYIYYTQARFDQAIVPFTRLTRIRPRSITGYNYLGGIYYYLERWPEATEMFEKCLEIDSTPGVISNLGTLYFYQARYADAARMYRNAIALSDDEYKIRAHLAESQYWSIDQRDASIRNFRKAAEMAEEELKTDSLNTVILSDLASYYERLGDQDRARGLLDEVISLDPQDVDVIIHIAETYEMLSERDTALDWIARAFEMGAPPSRVNRYPGLSQLRVDSRYKGLLEG
jgi:tetratricopeptide (TPR) repeat protein